MNIQKTSIQGVEVVSLDVHLDDRGYLFEVLHATDPFVKKFGQVYIVGDMVRGTIRAFHKHQELWDYFHIVHGSAKFAFHDDRKESPTYQKTATVVLSDRAPKLIVVPPGVYHGWMSLEDDTIMVSIGSEVYHRENPDEERVPYDSFGYDWAIQYK